MSSKNQIISLFSGAGGMDIGFQSAGFKTAVAVEYDKSCCDTLRKNLPDVPIFEGDICNISTEEILRLAKLSPLEPALVIGGPPCQSFSLAGKRMGMNDPRGQLVLEFIRVVRESLPVGFVMENVKGMLNWGGGQAIDAILQEASVPIEFRGVTYHYSISYEVLNAVDYGVPQFRERVFIIGNRVEKKFIFPQSTYMDPEKITKNLFSHQLNPWATVWDAIGSLPIAEAPSDAAVRVSQSIKERIKKHGY